MRPPANANARVALQLFVWFRRPNSMPINAHKFAHKHSQRHICTRMQGQSRARTGGPWGVQRKTCTTIKCSALQNMGKYFTSDKVTDAEIELVAGRWRKEHQILKDDANQKLRRMRVLRSEASKHVFPNVSYVAKWRLCALTCLCNLHRQ